MQSLLVETTVFGFLVQISAWGLGVIVVSALGVGYYIRDILQGKQVVIRSSWILLFLLDTVAFASQIGRGVFDPLIGIFVASSCMVTILSIWYGKSGWTNTETMCAVMVALSTVGLIIFPTAGLVLSLSGLTIATVPLITAILFERHYESIVGWSLIFVGSVLTVIDGHYLTGIWFGTMQLAVILPVIRHHGIGSMYRPA